MAAVEPSPTYLGTYFAASDFGLFDGFALRLPLGLVTTLLHFPDYVLLNFHQPARLHIPLDYLKTPSVLGV
jgi:hypothetical protein